MEQLSKIKVDPTFKLVMFYNMACCYQRLQLFDECAEYLEHATGALKERIAILEQQEQTMLHNKLANNQILLQPTNPSRNSFRNDRSHSRFDTQGSIGQDKDLNQYLQSGRLGLTTPANQLQNLPGLIASSDLPSDSKRSRTKKHQQLGGVHHTLRQAEGSSLIPSAIMQITTDNEHSLSLEKENQFHNEVYENLLAQKMQSLRYQCKLYLQICAIMSQLNKHRDALIFGQKSAQLCYQLIKDAQLLCKRQLAQIQRQTKKRD